MTQSNGQSKMNGNDSKLWSFNEKLRSASVLTDLYIHSETSAVVADFGQVGFLGNLPP